MAKPTVHQMQLNNNRCKAKTINSKKLNVPKGNVHKHPIDGFTVNWTCDRPPIPLWA